MHCRFVCLAIFIITAWINAQAQPTVRLEPVGQVIIPHNQLVDGSPVGGLSGLAYDKAGDKFYVISDDRSEYAPARFYSFRLKIPKEDSLKAMEIRWIDKTVLLDSAGRPYDKFRIDPEGIALGPDSLIYISSEGDPRIEVAPFVNGYDHSGRLVRELPIPEAYWSAGRSGQKWGVRINLGFEGLAISADGNRLYASLENALLQDGPKADSSNASPARMIAYDMSSGQVQHEFWYSVDPIFKLPTTGKGFAVNGLSDLLVLDNKGQLLTLERNFVQGQGNRILLYQASIKGATDVKDVNSLKQLPQPQQPVAKWLVADLADYGITIDNFEGMVLGPKLESGGRLLLMVSDDNFSSSQKTILTVFRIDY